MKGRDKVVGGRRMISNPDLKSRSIVQYSELYSLPLCQECSLRLNHSDATVNDMIHYQSDRRLKPLLVKGSLPPQTKRLMDV
jgi:hypothetical protein